MTVKPSPILEICAGIGKCLTVLGFAVSVTDIVLNPKLSEAQKALEIVTWLGAVVAMLQVGALIGGAFTLLPAMLITILVYLVITMLTLAILNEIETKVAYRRYDDEEETT